MRYLSKSYQVSGGGEGGRDVQRFLFPYHRQVENPIAAVEDRRVDAADFAAENESDFISRFQRAESGKRGEQVFSGLAAFQRPDFAAFRFQPRDRVRAVPVMPPGDRFFRAEGGFRDFRMQRRRGRPEENEFLRANGVGGPEDRADV